MSAKKIDYSRRNEGTSKHWVDFALNVGVELTEPISIRTCFPVHKLPFLFETWKHGLFKLKSRGKEAACIEQLSQIRFDWIDLSRAKSVQVPKKEMNPMLQRKTDGRSTWCHQALVNLRPNIASFERA